MSLHLSDYSYDLPKRLIATHPPFYRTQARLLTLDRISGDIKHVTIPEITTLLRPGDVVVINDSRVLKSRLAVQRPEGGHGELLLLKPVHDKWLTFARPASKFRRGIKLSLPDGRPLAEVVEVVDQKTRLIRFLNPGDVEDILEEHGQVPLPPYITRQRIRSGESPNQDGDVSRYQTVYAEKDGSVAAPTAGLHFTRKLLNSLEDLGVDICKITLHIGPGTFEPVVTPRITEHVMHEESFIIKNRDAYAIEKARQDPGRRIIAVGTTTVRALETCHAMHGRITPVKSVSRIFIHPGYRFRVINGMMTNFHLPESTLLMLVSAFAGRRNILQSYQEAIEKEYRFYSYGDAMFIS